MANGIYTPIRKYDPICLLLIIGVAKHRRKDLVTSKDAYPKLEANLAELSQ
ncbi:MAG: hypothetical protein ACTS73_00345 [Arsenophonus sp. NEOnobi-MAG3]